MLKESLLNLLPPLMATLVGTESLLNQRMNSLLVSLTAYDKINYCRLHADFPQPNIPAIECEPRCE